MCDTCEKHKIPEYTFGWRRHWSYFKYIAKHKWYVFKAGWKLGVPLLALLHDNSKFHPSEWRPYAEYFYLPNGEHRTGKASDGFTYFPPDSQAFRWAWLKHIQRNKHHPQYWVDIRGAQCKCPFYVLPLHVQYQFGILHRKDVLLNDDGGARCLTCDTKLERGRLYMQIREMPLRYRKEMLADWIGAGMAQGTPDTLDWYQKRGYKLPLGPQTRVWIEKRLVERKAMAS